ALPAFTAGTPVQLTLVSTADPLCTFDLGTFTDCCSGVCDGAVTAVIGTNTTEDLDCGAAASNLAFTGATDARWFQFTPPGTGILEIYSCGSGIDTRVTLHDGTAGCGSLGAGTLLGSNDDDAFQCASLESYVLASVNPAQTILIEWDDRWSSSGFDWQLDFTPCSPPANDLCVNEVPSNTTLGVGGSAAFSGTVDCASRDGIGPLFVPAVAGWAWHSFELTECADVTIDYCGAPYNPTTISTAFLVNGCNASALISPDGSDFTTCGDGQQTAIFSLGAGTYYVPVLWVPASGIEGAYNLNISVGAPSTACSTCDNATTISCGDILTGSTVGLPNTLPPTACAVSGPASTGGSVWYTFSSPIDTLVTLSTCVEDGLGTDFDTRLSVFEGTCGGTLCCVAYNDDGTGCSLFTSRLNFQATGGVTYFVVVHGYGTGEGNYDLFLGCGPTCSPETTNDLCSTAEILNPVLADGAGVPTVGDNTCAGTDPNTVCDPFGTMQGVWYSFNTGVNEFMQLTLLTSDEDGSYSSANGISYALYAGCDMSICPQGADGPELDCSFGAGGTSVLPTLTPGTDYVLNVWNDGGIGTEGTFGILLEFPGQNDAGISQVISPDGTICTTQVGPVVELTNFGAQPLTSVVITYTVDAGTPVV
ncbi:MAG: hypothetical protein KDC02_20675, partial [Flavobacteriales bacterium]|nr:hypothetical protein [Flavobacteriales bacterium]